LPDGAKKVRVFDDKLTGFIAEQRRRGVTFWFRYTDTRRRHREVKLGRLGDVTVDQARKRAEQLKASVSLGNDPVAERAKRRAVPVFADFARDRYIPHVLDTLRSGANIEGYLRLRILPMLGRKVLDEITPEDIAALRRSMREEGLAPATINRHLATVRSMFNLALKWGLFEGRNPASSPGMLRENHRDRYLTAEQTQALMLALDAEASQDAAMALGLLTVTGARRNEVLLATWANVDLDRRVLTVPRSKCGRPRHVALSPFAMAILERQLNRREPENDHVFPSRRQKGKALEGLRRPWVRVKKAAGLPADFRIHDLRHSFASVLANLGTPLHEIGVLLGHTQIATTQRYAHHAPQRLVTTATAATTAWGLPALGGKQTKGA